MTANHNNTQSGCDKDEDINALYQELESLREQVSQSEKSIAELRRRSDIQETQNQMLSLSLLPLSLREQLHKILLLILNIPWLSLEEQGCIFLMQESKNSLEMTVQHNLDDALLKMCENVPLGRCLCGKAALSQQLLFKNCLDADHEFEHIGMLPHGHYILPIVSAQKTLGILNLYVKHGHQQDIIERDFLQNTGHLLAGIIERKMMEQKLHRLSYHDDLTGLANRRHFMEYLNHTVKINQRIERNFAVLFLDLDNFKIANDSYGHDYGDEILIEAARRMENCIRQTDLLARLGGDEFVAYLNLLSETKYAVTISEKIQHVVQQPYHINGITIKIDVSIGISFYPKHSTDPETLLRLADQALYQAKEKRGCIVVYQATDDDTVS